MDCTSLAFNTQDTLPACSCYIQMRHFVRIGHILEDDVEHMHMISAHFEAVVSWIKHIDMQVLINSKMEAIQFIAAVIEKNE